MAQHCLAKAVKGHTCPSEFVIIKCMGSDLCTLHYFMHVASSFGPRSSDLLNRMARQMEGVQEIGCRRHFSKTIKGTIN